MKDEVLEEQFQKMINGFRHEYYYIKFELGGCCYHQVHIMSMVLPNMFTVKDSVEYEIEGKKCKQRFTYQLLIGKSKLVFCRFMDYTESCIDDDHNVIIKMPITIGNPIHDMEYFTSLTDYYIKTLNTILQLAPISAYNTDTEGTSWSVRVNGYGEFSKLEVGDYQEIQLEFGEEPRIMEV